MNRRDYLKALFAGTALAMVPVSAIALVAPQLFRLHGDGVTDDTMAMRALIDGREVIGPSGELIVVKDGVIRLPVGVYRMAA